MNFSAARSAVALEALSVSPEITFSTLCPVCNGGQSGEKKLSVTRTHNGALYVCFRAACGFRGFVAIGEGGSRDMPRKPSPARPFNLATQCPPLKAYRFANVYDGFARYTFADTVRDWGVSWAGDTIVYECRGFSGEVLGHVTRTPGKEVKTYRAREGAEMYSVYDTKSDNPWIVVEDCVSAMCCASHGYSAIALLGTNVPDAVDTFLRGQYLGPVIFLDPDAEAKSVAIASRYRLARAAIGYEKDPKDLPNLDEILRSYL